MNLKPKICLVVTGQTIDSFIVNLKSAQKLADMIELRVDFIKNLSGKHLDLISRQICQPAIFTCRSQSEGGHFQSNETTRLNLIKQADDLGFDFIDLELKTLQKHRLKLNRAKLIVSYHNFKTTPSLKRLQTLLVQMRPHRPRICKIATMVKSGRHLKTLWQLLVNKKNSDKLIVVGMGQKGKVVRLLTPLLGGYLTYASFNQSGSAPGQIDWQDLKLFYQQLSQSLYAG